jgi:hypothetical protein
MYSFKKAVETSRGRGKLVLYLDYDGVVHHENVRISNKSGPFLQAPERYKLFQHSGLLEELLEPYPDLLIVLSTSWAVRYGVAAAASRLPESLQARVIGGTFHSRHMRLSEFTELHRGQQVVADVARRQPRDWLALDDDEEGWGSNAHHHVLTHMYEGISDPEVLALLKQKLKAMK